MRTPKGWGAPKEVEGEIMEGSFRAHQVPLMKAKSYQTKLKQLQDWLQSYKPSDLLSKDRSIHEAIERIIPRDDSKKLGQQVHTYGAHQVLKIPDWQKYAVKNGEQTSCM